MTNNEVILNIMRYAASQDEKEKADIIEKLQEIRDDQFALLAVRGVPSISISYKRAKSKILIALGYPRVKSALPMIYEWLQNMNAPGVDDIWDELLLKLERDILIESLENAIRAAYHAGDTEWISWLKTLAKDAELSREDFAEEDNVYDIFLYHIVHEDNLSFYDSLNLLRSWGYPRIRQFIPDIVSYLCVMNPESWNWDEKLWNQRYEILEMIPEEIREQEIKDALAVAYFRRWITSIGQLKTKIPIEDTEEALREYLGDIIGPNIFFV